MPRTPPTPFLTLTAMLADLRYNWHASEYYIAPDEIIAQPRFTDPFRPKFYGIILCMQGWMDLLVNGHRIHMEPYCFFAGGPDMVFQRAGQSKDCKNKAVFFTKDFLLQNFDGFRPFESFHFFSTHFTDCVRLTREEAAPLTQLYAILKEKRRPSDSAYHIEIIRNLIFAYVYETAQIYQQTGQTFPVRFGREADLNRTFQELVAQNATREHRLQFYADALFVTPKYLIGAIKKITGQTPGSIIDEAIVAAAKIHLKDSRLNLTDIAERLHFSDKASFSKFFKKHTGFPPLAWRKRSNH